MKNELIKVTTNAQGQKLVSGRELYEVLGIKTLLTSSFSFLLIFL